MLIFYYYNKVPKSFICEKVYLAHTSGGLGLRWTHCWGFLMGVSDGNTGNAWQNKLLTSWPRSKNNKKAMSHHPHQEHLLITYVLCSKLYFLKSPPFINNHHISWFQIPSTAPHSWDPKVRFQLSMHKAFDPSPRFSLVFQPLLKSLNPKSSPEMQGQLNKWATTEIKMKVAYIQDMMVG